MLLLSGLAAAGCNPLPPDEALRRDATDYIERGISYPESPAVRAQAIEAAADVLGLDAAERIRQGLTDEHAGVRFAACMAIGKLKDAKARDAVLKLATDPDASVRIGAWLALERLGGPSYRRAWLDLLRQSGDAAVRRNAILALGHLRDPSTEWLLLEVASTDQDDGVAIQAWEALALLGNDEAIGRFVYEAWGGVGFKQPFALLTLGQVSDPRVVPVLRSRLLHGPYPETRLAAARSLGMQGYDDGFNAAKKLLDFDSPDPSVPDDPPMNQIMRVRSMAALALGEIGDRRALLPLFKRMKDRSDPRVQLAAATAILMILDDVPGI